MKKVLLTLGLATLACGSAVADGTLNPLNGPIRRLTLDIDHDGAPDRYATAEDGFEMRMFYGPANSTAENLTLFPQFAIIGTTPGIFTGWSNVTPIPGTQAGQIISVQMRASNPNGWYAESSVVQVALQPEFGPGAVIWGNPELGRIGHLTATTGPTLIMSSVPEPSTLALGGLACAFLLLRLRKPTRTN